LRNIFLYFDRNTLAYFIAIAVVVNATIVGLAPEAGFETKFCFVADACTLFSL
jgi:hypothetical protein